MKRGRFVLLGIFVVIVFVALANHPVLIKKANLDAYTPKTSDVYDPNDSFYSAKTIATGLTNNLTMNGTDTSDWFKIYVPANYRLVVNMNWSVHYDLDLYLYDSSYDDELDSSHANSTYLYENVSYDVHTAGYYYIFVDYWDYDHGIGHTSPPLNYSLYVDKSVPVSAVETMEVVAIVIVAVIAVTCVVGIVASQNRKKLQSRPPTTQSFRAEVQAPAPVARYAPQPSIYEPPMPSKPLVRSESPKPGVTRRFCSMCGAQLEPDQRFCHNCGMDMEALR